ncbi:MAG: hypothetical protein V7L31_14445 [Nostoc sp.]
MRISETLYEKPILKADQKKAVLGCMADDGTVTDKILATVYRAMVN